MTALGKMAPGPMGSLELPKPPLEVGSKFVGYEVRGLIGQGGHACVFHGYDSFMGQHVAIKVLHRPGGVTKEMMRRGQAEAQLLHRLRHPNIVEVSRAGIEEGLLFIVMELLRGRSLRTVLEQEGRLAVEEVLLLSAQIADAAAAAHDQKAIHRDLKPDNVFITAENKVKVLDFGIAKLMDHAAWTTQANIVIGTMLYMSPEQVQGLPLTPLSDIYALGLIMYTALFGRHPCLIDIETASFTELMRIQVMRNPPPLDQLDPRIPSYVARIVARAIAKLPEERPASMRAFAAEIRQCLERYAIEARQQGRGLQARDLSQADAKGQSGFRSTIPLAGAADLAPTEAVSQAFLGDLSKQLGLGGTIPLARDVVVPSQVAPPTPIMAPQQRRSAPPEDPSTNRYGSPAHGARAVEAPTMVSAAGPQGLPAGYVPPTMFSQPGPSMAPVHTPVESSNTAQHALPRRSSVVRQAAIAGVALGAVLGIGGGLFFAFGRGDASPAAASSSVVVEAISSPAAPAPEPPQPAAVAAPVSEPKAAASQPVASNAPPVAAGQPAPAAPRPVAHNAKPSSAPAAPTADRPSNDKMKQRLEWLEEDLKKPGPKPKGNQPVSGLGD